MELMSSLLFCMLAALMPQALGNMGILKFYNNALNNSGITKSKSSLQTNIVFDQSRNLFEDPICKICYNIIEKAIKSHSMLNALIENNHQNQLDFKDGKIRGKRKATAANTQSNLDKKSKKPKYTKNQSVSIIKYSNNDKVYALKVKENANNSIITCQVYSIQKHYPCESPDADLILTASKRKINKNYKKEQRKRQKNVSDTKRQ